MRPTVEQLKEPLYVWLCLEWCNEKRAQKGLEPLKFLPKGRISDPLSCPCGAATGLNVGSGTYHFPVPLGAVPEYHDLPEAVRVFVSQFDAGHLPQYIDHSS